MDESHVLAEDVFAIFSIFIIAIFFVVFGFKCVKGMVNVGFKKVRKFQKEIIVSSILLKNNVNFS